MLEPKIKSIIVDDEPLNADLLSMEIRKNFPEIEILKVCYSSKEGLKAIKDLDPDLIFLDIEMPVMNAFEMLDLAPKDDYHVIFTTAHDSYTLQAIKSSAIDYLLKPIGKEELYSAIQSYKKRVGKSHLNLNFLKSQIENIKTNKLSRIALPTSEGCIFIDISDIIYFSAEDMYSFVYLTNNTKVFLNKGLKYIEDVVCDLGFYRIHKSYLINRDKVKKIIKTDYGNLVMENGHELPIARGKKDEFINFMNAI